MKLIDKILDFLDIEKPSNGGTKYIVNGKKYSIGVQGEGRMRFLMDNGMTEDEAVVLVDQDFGCY